MVIPPALEWIRWINHRPSGADPAIWMMRFYEILRLPKEIFPARPRKAIRSTIVARDRHMSLAASGIGRRF